MNKRLLFQSKERYFIFMFLFPLAAYMDVEGLSALSLIASYILGSIELKRRVTIRRLVSHKASICLYEALKYGRKTAADW